MVDTPDTPTNPLPMESAHPTPIRHSPSLAQLGTALALAQQEIEGASKDSENPFFRARYADLASVWEACRKPLSKNGLAVLQPVSANGSERVTVTTILLHQSGEWIASDLTMTAYGRRKTGDDSSESIPMGTPQSLGSAITYARRYGLAAMVGVAPEDDDGEGAEGRTGRAVGRGHARNATACPKCGKVGTITKEKPEYGSGWFCWNRRGGCGAKFTTDPALTQAGDRAEEIDPAGNRGEETRDDDRDHQTHGQPGPQDLTGELQESIEKVGYQLFIEVCKFCNKEDVTAFLRLYLGTPDLDSIDAFSKVEKLKLIMAEEKKEAGAGARWVTETAEAYRQGQPPQPFQPTLVKPETNSKGLNLMARLMPLARRVGMKDGLKLMNAYLDNQFGHHDIMKPKDADQQQRLATVFTELEKMEPPALRAFLLK